MFSGKVRFLSNKFKNYRPKGAWIEAIPIHISDIGEFFKSRENGTWQLELFIQSTAYVLLIWRGLYANI
jgi:hypothetical protein